MKNAIYVFLLILISFCSCSTKDRFASILQQFVELNDAMGVEKVDVGVIVAQVKNTLNTGSKSYTSFFRTLETQCSSGKARLSASINAAAQSINDANSNINNWNKNLGSAKMDVKGAQFGINEGKRHIFDFQRGLEKLNFNYKVYATEADKKLNIVKVLRDMITDELLNRTPGALVQVSKFQEKLKELKELLNNNTDSLYSPMISVLLDLATEQNFSDQTVLRKILQNLNNLNNALLQFRANQEKALTSNVRNLRRSIKNTQSRIRTYQRMRAQANSKLIDATNYLAFYRNEVSHFSAEKNRLADQLNLFNKLCTFERKVGQQGKTSFSTMKSTVSNLFARIQQLNR